MSNKNTHQSKVVSQNLNCLAMEVLSWLGNKKPTREHISLIESLLSEVSIQQKLLFDRRLTKREVSCLRLAAQGCTTDQIAQLLNIKSTTVITFRNSIMRKLGCKTMPHAVFKGMQHGYLRSEAEVEIR